MFKRKLICKAGAALMASVIMLPMAHGAEEGKERTGPQRMAAAREGNTLEEVIVTARRKRENLQAVPISVTAISGETLAAQGVNSALTLAQRVPSLTILGVASPKVFTVAIRGVRATSYVVQDDPAVATYFAEGVIAHPYGFSEMMFDLQSVQVLKGPQGTLFGRNTTGGAVLVEPNKASIDEGFGGNAGVTVGNYNKRTFQGAVNIPMNDVAALRVAGVVDKRDGYTKNILTGQKLDEVDNRALRVSLLLKPTKDVTSHTILDYIDDNSAPASIQLISAFPGANLLGGAANTQRLVAEQLARGVRDVASWQGTNIPTIDYMSPSRCAAGLTTLCRRGSQPKDTLKSWGFLNNTKVDFNGFSLKNILTYRDMKHFGEGGDNLPAGSLVGTPVVGLQTEVITQMSQWSEELQVLGKALDNRLDWVVGAMAMQEKGSEYGRSYFGSANWSRTAGTGKNKSTGLFGQGTYAVNDRTNLTVGARRSFDTRAINDFATAANGTVCQVRNPATNYVTFLPIGACSLPGHQSWAANTGNASLDYKVTKGTVAYVTTRRGYHSGGFALRAHRADTYSYNPEFLRDWEVGIKSDWRLADRPIRTNLALFTSDYTNQQLSITTPSVPLTSFVANAGKSKITGGEFEFTYKMFTHFELSGFLSRSNPRYREYRDGNGTDLSYRSFGLPKSMYGISAAYYVPLESKGTLYLRADVSHQGEADSSSNLSNLGSPLVFALPMVPAFTTVNLRADWKRAMGSPIDVGFFVTNATDKKYIDSGSVIGGIFNGHYAPPRMIGLEVNYRFGTAATD